MVKRAGVGDLLAVTVGETFWANAGLDLVVMPTGHSPVFEYVLKSGGQYRALLPGNPETILVVTSGETF